MNRRPIGKLDGKSAKSSSPPCYPLFLRYNTLMESFRHNLSPVEVKIFLKTSADLTENLAIRYVHKIATPCPHCGHSELCYGAAVSYFSSSFDKTTHELTVCLQCGYKDLATLSTCERL